MAGNRYPVPILFAATCKGQRKYGGPHLQMNEKVITGWPTPVYWLIHKDIPCEIVQAISCFMPPRKAQVPDSLFMVMAGTGIYPTELLNWWCPIRNPVFELLKWHVQWVELVCGSWVLWVTGKINVVSKLSYSPMLVICLSSIVSVFSSYWTLLRLRSIMVYTCSSILTPV